MNKRALPSILILKMTTSLIHEIFAERNTVRLGHLARVPVLALVPPKANTLDEIFAIPIATPRHGCRFLGLGVLSLVTLVEVNQAI